MTTPPDAVSDALRDALQQASVNIHDLWAFLTAKGFTLADVAAWLTSRDEADVAAEMAAAASEAGEPTSWCNNCQRYRRTYVAPAGESAEGCLCCTHCTGVIRLGGAAWLGHDR